ncbi:MAG: hypothetical protein JXA08_10050 [Methanomicrobiaceae archaeon]|nr:hypothetical protein [Methanomicrobiaceae archaeon]
MPLSAIIQDQRVIGPDLSQDEWESLKHEHRKGLPVIMSCCGAKGHLRTSKTGLQHFYHARGSPPCTWEHESLAHLEIKNEIYQICKAAGWKTSVEYASENGDWRADVYAQKDDKKIVFEIQLSKIPLGILKERDQKYKQYGLESYWILKNKSKYQLHDNQYFEADLSDIPYIDEYTLTKTKYEVYNKSHFFIPKDVLTIDIDIESRFLNTGIDKKISLSDWINSVLNGKFQSELSKIREDYIYQKNLRKIAQPILTEVYDSHLKLHSHRKDLNRQYAIFKGHSVENFRTIKENFSICYNLRKEINTFFFGKVLSPKVGWKWIKSDYSTYKRQVLLLSNTDQLFEIQKLAKEASEKISEFEKLLSGLTNEIQSNIKNNSQRSSMKVVPTQNIQINFIPEPHEVKSFIQEPYEPGSFIPEPYEAKYKSLRTSPLLIDNKISEIEKNSKFHNPSPREIVKFEANLNLTQNWLEGSDGVKYQVIPGLINMLSKEIAEEFEEQGYGRII